MDLPQAVNTRIAAVSTITNLIGTRYHWGERDQGGTLPAVVFNGIGGFRDDALSEDGDIITSRIQASCLASSHATAWALAEAVGEALRLEASVSGFLFWEADVGRPIDLTVLTPGGPTIHEAVIDITLRHSAAS